MYDYRNRAFNARVDVNGRINCNARCEKLYARCTSRAFRNARRPNIGLYNLFGHSHQFGHWMPDYGNRTILCPTSLIGHSLIPVSHIEHYYVIGHWVPDHDNRTILCPASLVDARFSHRALLCYRALSARPWVSDMSMLVDNYWSISYARCGPWLIHH